MTTENINRVTRREIHSFRLPFVPLLGEIELQILRRRRTGERYGTSETRHSWRIERIAPPRSFMEELRFWRSILGI